MRGRVAARLAARAPRVVVVGNGSRRAVRADRRADRAVGAGRTACSSRRRGTLPCSGTAPAQLVHADDSASENCPLEQFVQPLARSCWEPRADVAVRARPWPCSARDAVGALDDRSWLDVPAEQLQGVRKGGVGRGLKRGKGRVYVREEGVRKQ